MLKPVENMPKLRTPTSNLKSMQVVESQTTSGVFPFDKAKIFKK